MEKKTMVADMILGLIFALDTIARFWLYSFFFSELHLQGIDFVISWNYTMVAEIIVMLSDLVLEVRSTFLIIC